MKHDLATLSAPSAGPFPAGRAVRRQAMAALVRVEMARRIRHPATIGALLLIALVLYAMTDSRTARYPVLPDADQLAQPVVVLLMGGAALILSNLAVLRPFRHDTAAALDVLVLPHRWRTAAHLLAVVPLGLFAAVVVAAHIAYLAALPGAAGRPNPFQLATGPVLVLLLGATGVLLGRLVRSAIAAPLLMVAFAAITFVSVALAAPTTAEPNLFVALLPATGGDPLLGTPSLPAELMTRPAGRHLAYLLGLLAVVTTLALQRGSGPDRAAANNSAPPSGERGGWLLVAATTALVVTVGAGTAQALPPDLSIRTDRIAATERPAAQQRCQRIDDVTYCAFVGFQPWVSSWDEVVRGVLRRMPADLAARQLAVRQRVLATGSPAGGTGSTPVPAPVDAWRADDMAAGTPNAITVGTWWGDGWSETGLAGRLAFELITRAGPGVSTTLCQARGVLIGWLAAQATDGTKAGLRVMIKGSGAGGVAFTEAGFGSGLFLADRELAMVLALLDQPDDEVGRRVLRSWDELTAAGTSIERAAEVLGVPAPPAGTDAGGQRCW
jgi:hypothetical protein